MKILLFDNSGMISSGNDFLVEKEQEILERTKKSR